MRTTTPSSLSRVVDAVLDHLQTQWETILIGEDPPGVCEEIDYKQSVVYSNGSDRESDFQRLEKVRNGRVILPALAFSRTDLEIPRNQYKFR